MPYAALSVSTVATMKTSLEGFAKEIEAMKKDKKSDKKKLADLQKQYVLKNQALCQKFHADIKTAYDGVAAMALKIEADTTKAALALKVIQAAAPAYMKTRKTEEAVKVETAHENLKEAAAASTKEMDDFAASWDAYRAWNPGGDPKISAEPNAIRAKIMDLTKVCRGKANNIATALAQAETLITAMKNSASTTAPDKHAEAEALLTRLETMAKIITTGKQNIDAFIPNTENMKMWVDAPIDALKTSMVTITQQYSHSTKAMQDYVTTLGSMQKTLAAGKASLGKYGENPETAALVRRAEALVADLVKRVDEAKPCIPKMAEYLSTAQKRMKKGK